MPRVTARVVMAMVVVLWVVYGVPVSLVVAVVGVNGAGDAAGWWWCCSWSGLTVGGKWSCPWTVGRPPPLMVVLVVSMLRLLEMPGSWRKI